MGNLFSPTHLLIILLIILILFGRGKISEFMGDFAKGIKSFKKGLSEEEEPVRELHNRLGDDGGEAVHNYEEKRQNAAERDSH